VINLGSVSNPVVPDLYATYVLHMAQKNAHRIVNRQVLYDRIAVLQQIKNVAYPSARFLTNVMNGEWVRTD
jgi:hypothetical protein